MTKEADYPEASEYETILRMDAITARAANRRQEEESLYNTPEQSNSMTDDEAREHVLKMLEGASTKIEQLQASERDARFFLHHAELANEGFRCELAEANAKIQRLARLEGVWEAGQRWVKAEAALLAAWDKEEYDTAAVSTAGRERYTALLQLREALEGKSDG